MGYLFRFDNTQKIYTILFIIVLANILCKLFEYSDAWYFSYLVRILINSNIYLPIIILLVLSRFENIHSLIISILVLTLLFIGLIKYYFLSNYRIDSVWYNADLGIGLYNNLKNINFIKKIIESFFGNNYSSFMIFFLLYFYLLILSLKQLLHFKGNLFR